MAVTRGVKAADEFVDRSGKFTNVLVDRLREALYVMADEHADARRRGKRPDDLFMMPQGFCLIPLSVFDRLLSVFDRLLSVGCRFSREFSHFSNKQPHLL